jgi:hypothetical protein
MPHAPRRRFVFGTLFLAGGGVFLAASFGAWPRLRDRGVEDSELQFDEGGALRFEWRCIDEKRWQAASAEALEDVSAIDAREGNRGACAPGTIEVSGKFLGSPDASVGARGADALPR